MWTLFGLLTVPEMKGDIMALKRMNKLAATALTAVMVAEAGLTSFVPLTAEAKEQAEVAVEEAVVNASSDDNFTWDNATVYFVMTDRFYNGNTSNDHSYGRSVGEVDADNYAKRQGTFHGGDLAGMTQKIEEGYFDDLGVNAIWITAPYEQIHGAICSEGFKHYAYHGYYALDFSNMDANMGTEEEMRKFVDTAHAHGIRVILDIVLNHVGYADPYTANEYGFGTLGPDWKKIYYETSEKDYHWYHDYSSETTDGKYTMDSNGDWTSGWWGPSWIRAVSKRFKGYEGAEGGNELTLCTGGLPDIKTEASNDNGIPPVLKTKWQKEGRYDQEVAELKKFFNDYSLQPTNANYVIKWLTDFVRDYGVDGFRCDTAKHVEKSNWGTLSKCGNQALKEWRAKQKVENPDDPAAYWDEEFWMTGEAWGHGVEKDDYYTTGGFDSMINFSFQGSEAASGAGLDGIYSGYAAQINNDPGFNVLSYISSHDKGLGTRSANAGTALLLCPGGVQIYYGDETGRDSAGVNGEQGWRSHMNWDSIRTDIQSNWQKVGRFRRDHASVGAGQHTKISESPYTFSRTYQLGVDHEDKVVVSLPGSAGTYDVSVGTIFADGETIKDAYSGEEYTVSGGSVSVTCDNNGVILLEGLGEIKPALNGKVSGKLPYTTETIDVKLSATKATDTYYSINGGEKVAYTDGTTITIGGGAAYDEVTTVTLTGKGEDGSELVKELTYKKCSEPTISAGGSFGIKVSKSEFATAPNIYVYGAGNVEYSAGFPGDTSWEDDGENWLYTNDKVTGEVEIILSQGEWRSTPHGEAGLKASGTMLFSKASTSLTEVEAGTPAKVTVNYVNEAGAVLKTVTRVGAVGKPYETSAATIPGCTLKETPANAKGTFTEAEITVTYVYSGGGDITPVATATPTVAPTQGGETTPTVAPTQGTTATPTVAPTQGGEATPTVAPTQGTTATPTVAPTQGGEATPTPTVAPTATPEELAIDGFSVTGNKDSVKLTAYMLGDSGKKVRYMYTYEKDGKEILIKNFQSESAITWKPTSAGKYTFNLYVIHNGNILTTSTTYTVR